MKSEIPKNVLSKLPLVKAVRAFGKDLLAAFREEAALPMGAK